MISLYKRYQIAYWCSSILLAILMIAAIFMFSDGSPYSMARIIIIGGILIFADAFICTHLSTVTFGKEICGLLNDCRANDYLDELDKHFKNKTKRSDKTIYNEMLIHGYEALDDYNAVYECVKNIKGNAYEFECHNAMFGYFMKNRDFDRARSELEELKRSAEKRRYQKLRNRCYISIRNAEYALRVEQGEYGGAGEYYTEILTTTNPLLPLTKASYSYGMGRLMVLKGEPDKAREYLQVASRFGGDTKYKKFADEMLYKLDNGTC